MVERSPPKTKAAGSSPAVVVLFLFLFPLLPKEAEGCVNTFLGSGPVRVLAHTTVPKVGLSDIVEPATVEVVWRPSALYNRIQRG